MILTLWLIFILWALKYYRPTKPKHKAPPGLTPQQIERNRKQAEREQAATEKRLAQIEQAELDLAYYESRLNDYMNLHRDTQALLDAAQHEVDTDTALNRYGAVVSVKTRSKHIAARDRLKKQSLNYESNIHTSQKGLEKAKRILDSAGKT